MNNFVRSGKKPSYMFVLAHLLAIFILGASSQAQEQWKLEDHVAEFVLDNGMTILVVERHDTPLAFCNLYYNVGSVREDPGITGISHLLEHMMFKGTNIIGVKDLEKDKTINQEIEELENKIYQEKFWKQHPDMQAIKDWETRVSELQAQEKECIVKDEFWTLTLGSGATFVNAATSQDMTGYYITLPANKIELQMVLESDRMVNSFFREFYTEKEVVREERRLSENSPGFFFTEQLMATFFPGSPYAWHVLGWDVDLQKITLQDLRSYYQKYYVPNNALAIYIGDVDPERILMLARKYFGPIPAGEPVEPVRTVDLPQRFEKKINDDQASKDKITVMYHIPSRADPQVPTLKVMGELLAGKSGRLIKRLVEEEKIATEVSIIVDAMLFDGCFEIHVELRQDSGKTMLELEQILTAEIEQLLEKPPTETEVKKARNQLLSSFYRSLRRPWRIAGHLAYYQFAAGNWRNLQLYLDNLNTVQPADVQAVAKKYFRRNNRIVGIQTTKNEKPSHDTSS
ncbi:M16 family metallopeptidase [candidate division CSSED10-310 bacterium]|uniref:M16 family metallopeptidase n=1 Tax=candidate division CSSED10-310 bacterium TaxID=2855610 RepID=A0ABV6Z5M7_UNCC1